MLRTSIVANRFCLIRFDSVVTFHKAPDGRKKRNFRKGVIHDTIALSTRAHTQQVNLHIGRTSRLLKITPHGRRKDGRNKRNSFLSSPPVFFFGVVFEVRSLRWVCCATGVRIQNVASAAQVLSRQSCVYFFHRGLPFSCWVALMCLKLVLLFLLSVACLKRTESLFT